MPLRGRTKAAIFVLFVGREAAAGIYPHLSEAEIEDLTMEIANLGPVAPETADEVLSEFWQAGLAAQFISAGDVDLARGILADAFGENRAGEIIQRLSNFLQVTPFDFIRRTDASNLVNFLHNEHPQTIALVLAYLHPTQSGEIIASLPPEQQADVARRMALMERTSPEVIREVERVMEKNLSSIISQVFTTAGGVDALVNVLNLVDRGTERSILEILETQDPQLASEIKNRMFLFEDIVGLDDRAIQAILREVDSKLLSLALRGVNGDVSNKIYKNMSKRAAAMLKEDMEYAAPVRVKDVESAQQQIVAIIRSLEEAGDIIMGRGEADKLV